MYSGKKNDDDTIQKDLDLFPFYSINRNGFAQKVSQFSKFVLKYPISKSPRKIEDFEKFYWDSYSLQSPTLIFQLFLVYRLWKFTWAAAMQKQKHSKLGVFGAAKSDISWIINWCCCYLDAVDAASLSSRFGEMLQEHPPHLLLFHPASQEMKCPMKLRSKWKGHSLKKVPVIYSLLYAF